jgi:tetratricopeptide (TPR) repeat protein
MPRALTQYRVFIGSPGGLDEERTCFHTKLTKFTAVHADERGVVFHPVGWEDTLGGVGRPQALINEDLKRCDYAVFVLHDRWGSPSGGGYTSGTEEEWAHAEQLYKQNKIRNIVLFFKAVDPRQMRDPGKQLESVLSFKKRIEEGKRYLFKQYDDITNFADTLEGHLARWLKDHEDAERGLSHSGLVTGGTTIASPTGDLPFAAPSFNYWITEAITLLEASSPDYVGALFCATKAVNAATSDIEWSRGINSIGIAQFYLGYLDKAIESFTEIIERVLNSIDIDRRYWLARGLGNKGVTLGALDRSAEAIAVYDDLLARFGTATELPLREQVAKAQTLKAGLHNSCRLCGKWD